jgi:hypothetical protein
VEPAGTRPRPTLLRSTFWIPAACLALVEWQASGYEGWGAWAAAPMFLAPLGLGLAFTALGAWEAVREARSGGVRPSTLALTAVAAAPLLWLLVRRHVT